MKQAKVQKICFGQFSVSIPDNLQANKFMPKFAGRDFWSTCMRGFNFPDPYWLECAQDLRQAKYSEEAVSEALNFSGLPSTELALTLLGCCTFCTSREHTRSNCPELIISLNSGGHLNPLFFF
jgi:hypothetical protein